MHTWPQNLEVMYLAYRGVLSIGCKAMLCISPKSLHKALVWLRCVRIPAKNWYSSYATISGGYANPVHILYELITDHGLGQIDNNSFQNAAPKTLSGRLWTYFI